MDKPQKKLKSPVVAAALTFLVPGLGHFYQGRLFKALLYLICIWGTFFFGLGLGENKVVNLDWHPQRRTWAYTCQLWAGVVAWPALRQAYGRDRDELRPLLMRPLSGEFTGAFDGGGEVVGQITLQAETDGQFPHVIGNLTGTLTTKGRSAKSPVNSGTRRSIPRWPPIRNDFSSAISRVRCRDPKRSSRGGSAARSGVRSSIGIWRSCRTIPSRRVTPSRTTRGLRSSGRTPTSEAGSRWACCTRCRRAAECAVPVRCTGRPGLRDGRAGTAAAQAVARSVTTHLTDASLGTSIRFPVRL